jgi:hypothetical protein
MRRLAEAGGTAHELMAFSGHKTLTEVQHQNVAAAVSLAASAAHAPGPGTRRERHFDLARDSTEGSRAECRGIQLRTAHVSACRVPSGVANRTRSGRCDA